MKTIDFYNNIVGKMKIDKSYKGYLIIEKDKDNNIYVVFVKDVKFYNQKNTVLFFKGINKRKRNEDFK